MSEPLILVAGAGGFIGGHLLARLYRRGGVRLRAVDIKPVEQWLQPPPPNTEASSGDLRDLQVCCRAAKGVQSIYNLAADMGGMGYIEAHKTECMLNVLINTHLLMAGNEERIAKYFFASSACVYAADKQLTPNIPALRESDAYPAMPEDGYGWEKLFSERMCRHFREDHGIATRCARYHNVYGTHETYAGGREKAPAAICRKIAEAKLTGRKDIEIWGDGEQTRSFTYIDDCLDGTELVMDGRHTDPVNVGSGEMVTINQLVSTVEEIAGVKLQRKYNLNAPRGVRGRNSDNSTVLKLYGWQPSVPLRTGMEKLYDWIYDCVKSG
jgi:GDP-D-mannose 3', 5'-epimerase